jgi:hypothetical protein
MVHGAADVPAGPASVDSVRVQFDEQRLVSDAGLLLTATLAERLGIEELVNESVWLDPSAPSPRALPDRSVRRQQRLDRDRRVVAQPRTLQHPARSPQPARPNRPRPAPHLLQIPARLTRTSRQWTLRMPARWPWQNDFNTVLDRIRALPTLA